MKKIPLRTLYPKNLEKTKAPYLHDAPTPGAPRRGSKVESFDELTFPDEPIVPPPPSPFEKKLDKEIQEMIDEIILARVKKLAQEEETKEFLEEVSTKVGENDKETNDPNNKEKVTEPR